jgi:hypothetical protein
VDGLEADELALGATARCALYRGNVKCWGHNKNGETGTGLPDVTVQGPRK